MMSDFARRYIPGANVPPLLKEVEEFEGFRIGDAAAESESESESDVDMLLLGS